MGRPLKKDVNGVEVLGSYIDAEAGIRCEFHDGSTVQTDGILMKQRGAKTFVVARVGTPATIFTRVLVNGTPAAGQMRILGSTDGQLPGTVAVAKLTKRVITDFSGNRYTWYLDNDSSGDVLVLTAI